MRTSLLLLTLFYSCFSLGQNTLTFEAAKDTYINSAIPNDTQGTNNSLVASAWTYGGNFGTGHSLIGFETCELPQDIQIVEAKLYLNFNPTSGHAGHTTAGLNSAKVFRITSSWNENTTWNTQPSYDISDFSVLPSSTTNDQDYVIDVTTIVANAFANTSNVGFYLKLDDEQTYRSLVFASREHPDITLRPKLEIIYTTNDDWCEGGNNTVYEPDSTCQEDMRIPNVFTPNNDGNNDSFYLQTVCDYSNFSIVITNRWGNVVFESNDQEFKWYGKKRLTGITLSEGVYFYKIRGRLDGTTIEKHGFVHLQRSGSK